MVLIINDIPQTFFCQGKIAGFETVAIVF